MSRDKNLMSKSLRANALFSATSALIFVLFSTPLAKTIFDKPFTVLGLTSELLLLATGIGLAGFAAYVFLLSRQKSPKNADVIGVIIADYCWVTASAIVLLFAHTLFTIVGVIAVVLIAVIVGLFGSLQWIGLSKHSGA